MALKDSWEDLHDKIQGVPDSGSEISVEPINDIAHAVIELEEREPVQSNVQADWNEQNPENPAYIKNKPDIPNIEGLATEEYVNAKINGKADKSNTLKGYGITDAYTKTEIDSMIYSRPITEIPLILEANKEYNFGEVSEISLAFPTVANDGAVIYLTFKSGATATALTIDTTNTSDIEVVPEANTGYEIFGKYNGSIWIVNYSEYTVSEG